MTDLSIAAKLVPYKPKHKVRFVTATSLFDGHDASINIMRRILQATGVEVIHLGHNRSVDEIVNAALQEDVQGIAVSSYQGGHVEFFKYMIDLLKAGGGENIKVFGGGGGVIVPAEIGGAACLRRDPHLLGRGRPEDGPAGHDQRHGEALRRRHQQARAAGPQGTGSRRRAERLRNLAQIITALENGAWPEKAKKALPTRPPPCRRARRWASPAPAAPASPR
jgi:methylmalonyl-CoA mutase